MKEYSYNVRNRGMTNIHLNVGINFYSTIWETVWNNVMRIVYINVKDRVNVRNKHKLFKYNSLQQYKDNL
jgi:hypothetical protein